MAKATAVKASPKTITLTPSLHKEYQNLWKLCKINVEDIDEIDLILSSIGVLTAEYQRVEKKTGVPWYVVAVIHSLESGCNIHTHLHNGDLLTSRTIHVPKGRPKTGKPTFKWYDSAIDAMRYKGLDQWMDWEIPGILFKIEEYNGFGYRLHHPAVLTPYLWAGSNHYIRGKYKADGVWSEKLASKQIGAAVLLLRMVERGIIDIKL